MSIHGYPWITGALGVVPMRSGQSLCGCWDAGRHDPNNLIRMDHVWVCAQAVAVSEIEAMLEFWQACSESQ